MVKSRDYMTFFRRFAHILLPLLFLVIGLFTLYDYGMNWDSPVHFARGQAYLRYILTGKTNYDDLPKFCLSQDNLNSRVDWATGEVCDRHRNVRVSEYESNLLDFNSWVATSTYGHPAFSDIMLALSNNIFYKHLGLVEDINAYHLYSIFATFLLALTIAVWTRQTFGIFASVIAVLTLWGVPLFFSESHFNIKDPPMAVFLTISLYFFWLGIVRRKPIYLLLSALAGGASMGTKLNFVFTPFILVPWLLIYSLKTRFSFLTKKMILAIIFYPVIVLAVFVLSWPALWSDPAVKLFQVVSFYQDIGGSPSCPYSFFTPNWFTQCFQTTTLQYLIYTLPLYSLFLLLFGLASSLVKFREKSYVIILWLALFLFTTLRVTLSFTNIYGGLRQIMEFIPAMAMIAAVGALFLRGQLVKIFTKLSPSKIQYQTLVTIISTILILGNVPIYIQMAKMHPWENVYFNSLIGGLKGAAEKDIPGFGNTYGSVTLQGVKWINENTEPHAKLALVSGNAQNISRAALREDIEFSNGSRSGYNLEGEYQILSIVGQDIFSKTFRYQYLDKYLEPVYDLKVDGVTILKIWKNDKEHLKSGLDPDNISKLTKTNFSIEYVDKEINLKLDQAKSLKALGVKLENQECRQKFFGTNVQISEDGREFEQKPDNVNGFTDREITSYRANLVYLFPGDTAQYIKLALPLNYHCKLTDIKFSVYTLAR